MKEQTASRHQSVSSMFVIVLLLIFTLFSLMLAGFGSAIYRSSTDHMSSNYSSRTAAAYLSEKIRQHDTAGALSFSTVEQEPALVLNETISGESFSTYIYYYENSLYELMVRSESVPSLNMGSPIVELTRFSFSAEDSLLNICVSDKENEYSFYLALADEVEQGGAYE